MPTLLILHFLVLKLHSKIRHLLIRHLLIRHLLIRHPLMLVIVPHPCCMGVDAIGSCLGVEFGWIVGLHGIRLNPLIGNHLAIVEFRRVLRFDSIRLHSLRGSMRRDRQRGRRHDVYVLLRPWRTSHESRWWSGLKFTIRYIKAMNHRATGHRAAGMKAEWWWDVGLWTGRLARRSGQWNSGIEPTLKYVSYRISTAKSSIHTRTASLLLARKKIVALFTSRFVTPSPRRIISAASSSRYLFWASDLGRRPMASDVEDACELERGISLMLKFCRCWWCRLASVTTYQ